MAIIALSNKRKGEHKTVSKKLIALIVAAAIAVLVAMPAFAATSTDASSWFENRISAKKAWVDQAVKNGSITAEQGETWKKHFDDMLSFRQQNGFVCPMGGPGKGQGFGMGNGKGFGRGGGMGTGGWGFNQSQSTAPVQQ